MAGDKRGYATSVVQWYGKRTGGSDVTDVQKGLVLNDLFKSSWVKGLLMGFEAGLGTSRNLISASPPSLVPNSEDKDKERLGATGAK